MPYLSSEEIRKAKEPDALSWLISHEPDKLVRISGGYYRSREHDSLKFDHERWNWWSKGIGGRSAVDYLIKVEGHTFYEACQKVLSGNISQVPAAPRELYEKRNAFVIPERANSNEEAIRYLKKRCICPDVIGHFLFKGDLFQQREHKNVVFLGRDFENVPRMASLRGIYANYHHTVSGSNRTYGFRNRGDSGNKRLDVFEAPVDLLSYATLLYDEGEDFTDYNMLALCGIYKGREKIEETKVPAAISAWMDNYNTEVLVLHFDNDNPGREAAEALSVVLGKKLKVIISPPPAEKDVNAYVTAGGRLWKEDI